jgi:hypothetical protein
VVTGENLDFDLLGHNEFLSIGKKLNVKKIGSEDVLLVGYRFRIAGFNPLRCNVRVNVSHLISRERVRALPEVRIARP